MIKGYLGVDVGSVTTKLVVLDDSYQILEALYLRTRGSPIEVVQEGLTELDRRLGAHVDIIAAGTTGSGRYLAGVVIGATLAASIFSGFEVPLLSYPSEVMT